MSDNQDLSGFGAIVAISNNDSEAAEIIRLIKARNADIEAGGAGEKPILLIELNKDWGEKPTISDFNLSATELALPLYIVEAPDPRLEAALEAKGYIVKFIDHHLYLLEDGQTLDRRHAKSSIEQLAASLNLPFSDQQQKIAANDRGFIPTLSEVVKAQFHKSAKSGNKAEPQDDLPPEALAEIWRIRLEELAKRPQINGLENARRNMLAALEFLDRAALAGHSFARLSATEGKSNSAPELLIIHAPESMRFCLLDALYAWDSGTDRQIFATTIQEQPISASTGQEQPEFDVQCDEAALLPSGRDLTHRREALLLFYPDERQGAGADADIGDAAQSGHLTLVEFSGNNERVALFSELAQQAKMWDSPYARMTIWLGGSDGMFFNAQAPTAQQYEKLHQLGELVLENLLAGNRPLIRWRSHFFQMLHLEDPNFPQIAKDQQGKLRPVIFDSQERDYFLPFLRRYLMPDEAEYLKASQDFGAYSDTAHVMSFEVPTDGMRLEVHFKQNDYSFDLPFRSIRLHFFMRRHLLIEWSFSDGIAAKEYQSEPLWRVAIAVANARRRHPKQVRTMADLLDFNARARMIYSAFQSDSLRTDITLRNGKQQVMGRLRYASGGVGPERGWQAALIAHIEQECIKLGRYSQMFDERARVLSCAVGAGQGPGGIAAQPVFAQSAEDEFKLLARFHDVDPHGLGYDYDPEFNRREIEKGRYTRFRHYKTHYVASGHAFAFLGYGDFAYHEIYRHMGSSYLRMFILILLYESAINQFFDELQESMHSDTFWRSPQGKYRRIRKNFVYFTNGIWFQRVSSQVQGAELFDLLQSRSLIGTLYDEAKEEIERTDELLQAEAGQRQNLFNMFFAAIAGFLAAAVAFPTLRPETVPILADVTKPQAADPALAPAEVMDVILTNAGQPAPGGHQFIDALYEFPARFLGQFNIGEEWMSLMLLLVLSLLGAVISASGSWRWGILKRWVRQRLGRR